MRALLVLLSATIVIVSVSAGGFFKQEYQFQQSSATFKNNQLQTKNDDEGYYGKQGELDGRTPSVEQHNSHSEFVHPSVDGVGHSLTTYNDRDLTAQAESAFKRHNLNPGTAGQYSFSSNSQALYSLPSVVSLQTSLSQQLQEAIECIRREQSAYSAQLSSSDVKYLENQLRANLTRELQNTLDRYNTGSSSGWSSQSIRNYDSRDVNDLTRRIEANLLKELNEGSKYSNQYSSSFQSSSHYGSSGSRHSGGSQRTTAEVDDLNRRLTYQPSYQAYDDVQRPEKISYGTTSSSSQKQQQQNQFRNIYHSSNYDRDFPVALSANTDRITINPSTSITNVIQNVQNQLSEQVTQAVRNFETKYTSTQYTLTNSRPDYQTALDDLKRDLRYNLTRKIQDELDRHYGQQEQRNGYSFSYNSRNNANYRLADLEDLKRQAENNLIEYLETSFRSQETRYQKYQSQYLSTKRDYSQHGPSHTYSLTSDIAQNPSYVRYEPGAYVSPSRTSSYQSQSSYSASSSSSHQPSNVQLQQIQTQLREDLNRQLQSAVREQSYSSSYSTSRSNVEQILTDELKSNITRRLEDTLREHFGNQAIKGGQSYTVSASGVYNPNANYRTDELSMLQRNLQEELVRNLKTQLQTQSGGNSYSSHSQYSASSSFSPTYHHGSIQNSGIKSGSLRKYGNFEQDEDCMQGDQVRSDYTYSNPYHHTHFSNHLRRNYQGGSTLSESDTEEVYQRPVIEDSEQKTEDFDKITERYFRSTKPREDFEDGTERYFRRTKPTTSKWGQQVDKQVEESDDMQRPQENRFESSANIRNQQMAQVTEQINTDDQNPIYGDFKLNTESQTVSNRKVFGKVNQLLPQSEDYDDLVAIKPLTSTTRPQIQRGSTTNEPLSSSTRRVGQAVLTDEEYAELFKQTPSSFDLSKMEGFEEIRPTLKPISLSNINNRRVETVTPRIFHSQTDYYQYQEPQNMYDYNNNYNQRTVPVYNAEPSYHGRTYEENLDQTNYKNVANENFMETEDVQTTTEPGFWTRVGGKIKGGYEKVKDKAKSLGESIGIA